MSEMTDKAAPDIEPSDLLVFLDETGDEDFSDPQHQVFGLGGCAIRAGLYDFVVREPWLAMRDTLFNDHKGSLHASEMRLNKNQMVGLADFFRAQAFIRVAALVTPGSGISNRAERLSACCDFISAGLQHFAQGNRASRLVFVIEASSKRPTAASRFLHARAILRSAQPQVRVPIAVGTMTKSQFEAGLEVADFVMHAAGGQLRLGTLDDRSHRKDFAAVFGDVPDALVRFAHVQRPLAT